MITARAYGLTVALGYSKDKNTVVEYEFTTFAFFQT